MISGVYIMLGECKAADEQRIMLQLITENSHSNFLFIFFVFVVVFIIFFSFSFSLSLYIFLFRSNSTLEIHGVINFTTFVNRLKYVVRSIRKHGWAHSTFTKVSFCWWAYIWHGKQDTSKYQRSTTHNTLAFRFIAS